MINTVCLTGRLTRDPELRKTPNGASTVGFTLAVERKIKANNQPDSDFIGCVAWNKTAEIMAQYLHKGSLLGIEGRIQTRSYDNNEGKKVYVTEVVVENLSFLEPRHHDTKPAETGMPTQKPIYYQTQQERKENVMEQYDQDDTLDIASDDLPF